MVRDRQEILKVPQTAIRRMVQGIFDEFALDNAEVSIVFCDDQWITNLNAKYMGVNGPTNVLSFPMIDNAGPDSAPLKGPLPEHERMLGDIVVNIQRAVSDAEKAGIEPAEEVAFLVVHGLCHLLGFDHEGENRIYASKMDEQQKRLFKKYGVTGT